MSNTTRVGWLTVSAVLVLLGSGLEAVAQSGLPNPYRAVRDWAKMPPGRSMGAVGGVTIDLDGEHIWALIRCDATAPELSNAASKA